MQRVELLLDLRLGFRMTYALGGKVVVSEDTKWRERLLGIEADAERTLIARRGRAVQRNNFRGKTGVRVVDGENEVRRKPRHFDSDGLGFGR
jgi:hypothetical protein